MFRRILHKAVQTNWTRPYRAMQPSFARRFSTFGEVPIHVVATSPPYRIFILPTPDQKYRFAEFGANDFRDKAFYKFNYRSLKQILMNTILAKFFLKPPVFNAFMASSDNFCIKPLPAKIESYSGCLRYNTGPVRVFPEPKHKASINDLLKLYYPDGSIATLTAINNFTVKLCDQKGNILSDVEYGPGKKNLPSKRTTGWTESTRNQFHPGDIITALRTDNSGYSPHNLLGATELACHLTGKGREFSYLHVGEDGAIKGFHFIIVPLMEKIQPILRDMFPELAKFSDLLTSRDLKSIFESTDEINELVKEIETKFGKAINVPAASPKKESHKKNEDGLVHLFLLGDRRSETTHSERKENPVCSRIR